MRTKRDEWCRTLVLLSTLLLGTLLSSPRKALAGTWTPLVHSAPEQIQLMLQLSDGTVLAAHAFASGIGYGKTWYRLTPDIHGSYVNGTWSALTPANDTRLWYSSQVLMDGRVFVAGGEYGTGSGKAEIYDPLTNAWTQVNPPTSLLDPSQPWVPDPSQNQSFYDSVSEILPNGSVMIAPVLYKIPGVPLIYNPTTNLWSQGPHYIRGNYQDETSWVKLPDNSILTIDPFRNIFHPWGTLSERYIPATNTWVDDGILPVLVIDPVVFELGAGVLLANGKAFYLGSTGHTALYTPSGNNSPGVWTAGPDIPGGHGTPDAAAAVMVTGNVLCATSDIPTASIHYASPTTFYEYDPVANSFTSMSAPNGPTDPIESFRGIMLTLPDGNVLYSHFGTDLYVYSPAGSPLAAGKPAISSITPNGDGSYHLVGTGLNGISEGAAYGDDVQPNSNYPLVRLADLSGNVYYARTYNWSSTGVQTGATPISTEFRVPATVPVGLYSLVVVASGNASDPVPFSTAGIPADCDGNGLVELDPDIACFVEVLLGNNNDPGSLIRMDLTGDGVVDGRDIPQFISCLTGGPCP